MRSNLQASVMKANLKASLHFTAWQTPVSRSPVGLLLNHSAGKFENIGGFNCYVATPTGDYPKDIVVLFLTDVFGLALNNNLVRPTIYYDLDLELMSMARSYSRTISLAMDSGQSPRISSLVNRSRIPCAIRPTST